MNPSITTSTPNLVAGALLLAAAGSLSASGCEEAYCIDWFTIDSGGTIVPDRVHSSIRLYPQPSTPGPNRHPPRRSAK